MITGVWFVGGFQASVGLEMRSSEATILRSMVHISQASQISFIIACAVENTPQYPFHWNFLLSLHPESSHIRHEESLIRRAGLWVAIQLCPRSSVLCRISISSTRGHILHVPLESLWVRAEQAVTESQALRPDHPFPLLAVIWNKPLSSLYVFTYNT
jgi:hypothetical protein